MADTTPDENTPPQQAQDAKSEHITIVVRDQNSDEKMHFKVKKTTRFEKVFTAYCTRKSVSSNSVKFLFDGQRLAGDSTPKMFEMEDNDIVDCMIEQQGGH